MTTQFTSLHLVALNLYTAI